MSFSNSKMKTSPVYRPLDVMSAEEVKEVIENILYQFLHLIHVHVANC